MVRANQAKLLFLIAIMAVASACGTTSGNSSVIRMLHDIDGVAPASNILVVSAAGDRTSRAQFERELAAAISSDALLATTYFAVVGRYTPVSRNVIDNAVRDREFDAILLVRQRGQEKPGLVRNRPTGRLFDLYLNDYGELNDLSGIDVDSTVSFVAEFYDTENTKKVWAIESLIFENESVAPTVSAQVAIIAAELRRDRLIRR